MSNGEYDETHALWNRVADDWQLQVGEDGDGNRILNSDPVLWAFAGDVHGLSICLEITFTNAFPVVDYTTCENTLH